MANYSVKLHPNLVDLGTEGSLDTSVLNGKSIQRTVSGITIINLGERKTLGRLKDGEQFSDVVETLCDYLNISSDDCNPEEELYVEITASGILGFGKSAIYELISDENNSYNYSASGLFALGQSADYNNNTGWGALFGIDTVNSDLYYPQSADMDADGNVYYASVNTSGNPVSSILRKMDSNGNILWEKPDYGIDETHTPVKVKVSINGGIYVIYQQRMIRRIDSNGVELWKFNQNLEYYSFSFDGFVEDSNGNIFVVGSASGLLLCKFNSSGTLIKETQLNVGGTIVGDIVIDNSGNLIVPFSIYLNDGGLSTVLIKITNDLLSYTWYTTLSQDYGYIYDASVTAFGKDNSDNFYVLTYGSNTVTKINGSGTIIWAKDITASEVPALNGMAVDNDGNCYVVCGDSDGGTFIRVLKVDTNGNIIWSYKITFTSGMEFINQGGYYYTTNSAVQIKNGYMILLTRVQIQASPLIIEEFVMKLPLEKITGTFGDFVFSDDILNVSMTDLSPVDNSSNVSISFVESSIVSPGSGQLFEEPEFSQTLTLVPIVTGE